MSYRSITGVDSFLLNGFEYIHLLEPRRILCKLVWHTVRVALFREAFRFCDELSFPKLEAALCLLQS